MARSRKSKLAAKKSLRSRNPPKTQVLKVEKEPSPEKEIPVSSPEKEIPVSSPKKEISVSSPKKEISVSSPKKEISVSRDPEEDFDCSICLDTTRYTRMKTLCCKHTFHEKCVNMSLERNPHCPLCRCPSGYPTILHEYYCRVRSPHDPITNSIMRHMYFLTFQVLHQ